MDRGMVIFLGAVLTFSSSWLGLVVFPFWQLGKQQPYQKDEGDEPYPQPLQGKALAGRKVYQNNGCMYCHTQQVRSEKFGDWWDANGEHKTGADIKRSYGLRRTVSRDYIYDNPTMLGTMRTGPDLANIGARNPSDAWHHTHLLNPRSANGWSIMPSFAYLYSREKIVGSRSDKALTLGREWTVDPGYRWRPSTKEWDAIVAERGSALVAQYTAGQPEPINIGTPEGKKRLLEFWLTTPEEEYQVVPNAEGDALVAYLLALRKAEVPLPEAKE
ncbi:cytochrome c oxidase mono-heme subunit : Cytochrome C oxidase mono-heme subunit/FixO OS=Isosphaera pallida (strain ATCC 43644 / DSM 9630 / IS1B) GN=Isop_0397 PE=4 SV=1: FixO [Gemmata massiliana]|uniref:Cytochrome c domain-containing protein n=1 Tax=Gemmata massiliana TaxID=1210884 RepID=A0A6P2CVN1_9BACT|nr:cbb3-type cytochrome c oxidase subunit II [Gemmata massiliana]VTR91152.1 cytochrome c oxidase mono-heme subunit : Cytochrome C oxidase mono-heme subunit/FixO OS=Isosphaera pallida (strain ATCC 43644 / DSM 9630 / IS1B) GN=Isop_0397 PE=4 SV=1: FixO [Gemmata massiliana]